MIITAHVDGPFPRHRLRHPLAGRIAAYLDDVVSECGTGRAGAPVVSVVVFGSAATGGHTATSDVDLLVVVVDEADSIVRHRLCEMISSIESRHGLGKQRVDAGAIGGALAAFADRMTANVRAFFICTRTDLLSGDPGRILGLPPLQARFVDRVAIPSIIASGVTVWGEDLLDAVPLPPIRRLDVAKAFVGLFGQALFTAVSYPFLPEATRYAMDTLKRSVHNCHFCHHSRSAPLAAEVAYFERQYGPNRTLAQLLALREAYRPSIGFVLGCLPTITRLHWRTACALHFPRAARP